MTMKSVAVFCGSNFGVSDHYAEDARRLGRELAVRRLTLVYGGTHKGLMGVLADEVLGHGGEVVGIINQRLHDRGHLHPALTRHEVVPDMRARKARMAELSDACIALPGGLGTLEELFEMATLTQLGDHAMGCGALNTRGYYDPLRAMLDHGVREGFLRAEHREMIVLEADPAVLLDRLAGWQPPGVTKWIERPRP
jgi:uncharacterized protein (TIGR00730 family)